MPHGQARMVSHKNVRDAICLRLTPLSASNLQSQHQTGLLETLVYIRTVVVEEIGKCASGTLLTAGK